MESDWQQNGIIEKPEKREIHLMEQQNQKGHRTKRERYLKEIAEVEIV